MPEEINIGEIIDKFLDTESRAKVIGSYYPSEAGMCMRRVYYSYMIPKSEDRHSLRIFALGNNIHSFLADALKTAGDFSVVNEEVPVRINYSDEETTFSIYGRMDDFIVTQEGKKIIIEAKSVSDINRVESPDEKHLMQINLYLKAEAADYGMLVYIDKKNMDIRQFRVDFNEELYNKTVQRIKDLDLHLKTGKLPPAEYYFNDQKVWECKYCPYRNECMEAIAKGES